MLRVSLILVRFQAYGIPSTTPLLASYRVIVDLRGRAGMRSILRLNKAGEATPTGIFRYIRCVGVR